MTRVLAVADADSYLKWSAATLERLPPEWSRRQLLLASPITPSPSQAVAAIGRPLPAVTLPELLGLVRREQPDVLLLGCTGPTTAAITWLPQLRRSTRPVLVAGLPGISVPGSARAVESRAGCDVLVVHSRRERSEFAALAAERATGMSVALSRLPFLTGGPDRDERGHRGNRQGERVVFAAQAKVPPRREDRRAILLALAEIEPAGTAMVKVRARPGEQQTHHEEHPYGDIWAELAAAGRIRGTEVEFATGPMSAALAEARCLVTVSSTAALEAVDAGVPIVVLSDFGVDEKMINVVFEGSGCFGSLGDVREGRAYRPPADWLADNYFHPPAEDDLVAVIESALDRRRSGPRRRSARRPRGGGRGLVRLLAPRRVVDRLRGAAG